ncbi:MAG TPA: hypothetical protein VEB00_03595 [Clostridia bacterium]|nr:hypothetical protein [Clostridia bacterium]
MSENNLGNIDYDKLGNSIAKAWHNEKEAREAAKAEKEAKDKEKEAFKKNLTQILSGGIILILLWICFRYINSF